MRDPTLHKYIRSPLTSVSDRHQVDVDNSMHTTAHSTHNTHNHDHYNNSMRKRPENISRSSSPQPLHERHRHDADNGTPMHTLIHPYTHNLLHSAVVPLFTLRSILAVLLVQWLGRRWPTNV